MITLLKKNTLYRLLVTCRRDWPHFERPFHWKDGRFPLHPSTNTTAWLYGRYDSASSNASAAAIIILVLLNSQVAGEGRSGQDVIEGCFGR